MKFRNFVQAAVLACLLTLPISGDARAQVRNETQILAIEGVPLARALDIEDETVAFAAKSTAYGGTDEGLYFFDRDASGSWNASPRFLPSDYDAFDQFGAGLAVSGNRLAVSAYNHDTGGLHDAGVAYIYERDLTGAWVQMAEVSPGIADSRFGNNGIGLDGDVLAGFAATAINKYSLFIFDRDGSGNWLQSLVTTPESMYAQRVRVSGDTVVLGLPRSSGAGEVRLYQRRASSWTHVQSFVGTSNNPSWGREVAIEGELLAFASNTALPGEVRLNRRSASGLFQLNKVFTMPSNVDVLSIALSGDRLVVTATNSTIYVYERNVGGPDNWGLEVSLASSVPFTKVSSGVAISGTRVVSLLRYTDGRFAPGMAALFDVVGPSSSLDVALSGPACTTSASADLLASIDSSHDVDQVRFEIGSTPAQTLCIDCGIDPLLAFSAAPLATCLNTVKVTATDVLGLSATATHQVRFDDQAPTLDADHCTDRAVLLPAGRTSAALPRPRALDNCDTLISPTCSAGPYYPLGTTATTCSRTDACGNTGSCSFTVTVATEDGVTPGGPACLVDDFEDTAINPAWTLAGVGDVNQHLVSEGSGFLELTADGSTAFYGTDNAGFLYREMTGDFRAEVTVDGNTMTSGGGIRKAGLMVRQSLDTWDVRLIAQLAPFWQNSDENHLQFVARTEYGGRGSWPVAQDVIGVPRIVRLAVERAGDTLTVEYSLDGGTTWIRPTTGLGGSVTIEGLAPTLLVGLDILSNNVSVTSTARFDDASICPTSP